MKGQGGMYLQDPVPSVSSIEWPFARETKQSKQSKLLPNNYSVCHLLLRRSTIRTRKSSIPSISSMIHLYYLKNCGGAFQSERKKKQIVLMGVLCAVGRYFQVDFPSMLYETIRQKKTGKKSEGGGGKPP